MAKFEFKLAPLRKFRENRLLAGRRELAEVQAKLMELVERQRKAVEDRAALLGATNIEDAIRSSTLVETETARIRDLQAQIRAAEEDFDRHRRWVAHLGAELKAIEKLEEKKRAEFESELRLRDKRLADAWVAERWSRTKASGDLT